MGGSGSVSRLVVRFSGCVYRNPAPPRKKKSLIVFIVFSFFGSLNLGFPQGFGGPGGFRKLREACRKNFHLVVPLVTLGVTSYDRKTKTVKDGLPLFSPPGEGFYSF